MTTSRNKKITAPDMHQLRAVLRDKDGTTMWKALDRMKLSPNDQVVMHKKVNNSVLLGCDVVSLFLISGWVQDCKCSSYVDTAIPMLLSTSPVAVLKCVCYMYPPMYVLHSDGNRTARLLFLTAGQTCNFMWDIVCSYVVPSLSNVVYVSR